MANDSPASILFDINGNPIGTSTAHPLRIDPIGTTIQPISGTVIANQGTYPWITNISQFGGNNVVTGTGASGIGIPRITISNDSNILATQSGTWTVNQGTPPWTIQGKDINGASTTANPVLIGGSDGTNTRTFATDIRGDVSTILTSPLALAGQFAHITPYANLRVTEEPSTLLQDKFDGTVLDPINWSTNSNLAALGFVLNKNLQINTGTTPSAYSAVFSNAKFFQQGLAYLQFGVSLQFEYPVITNMHRFWGLGTPNANTTAAPLLNAVGFELDTSGNLNAVVYSSGTKIFSQTLTTPTNGSYNRYSFTWRTDTIYYFANNTTEYASAIANFQIPQSQILPIRFHTINGSTPPSSAGSFMITAVGTADSARNNVQISDGTYAWRKLSVDATGSIPLQESTSDGNKAPSRAIQIGAPDNTGSLRALNAITDGGKMLAVQDEATNDLLRKILNKLCIISIYLSQMSDLDLE